MSESARILATEAMAEARAALAEFAGAADRTLTEVDSDIQRLTEWLRGDRVAHWKREIRVRQEEVLSAKAAIAKKELARSPDPVSTVEERRTLQRARQRLEEAERRQEATRRWGAVWEREAMAYKGPAHQLRDAVAGKIPAALSRIARMMESVESYLSIAPPPGGDAEGSSEVPPAEPSEEAGPGGGATGGAA